MSQVADEKKKMKQNSRQPYKKPRLLVYGAVKDLTASGSTGPKENSSGQGTVKKP